MEYMLITCLQCRPYNVGIHGPTSMSTYGFILIFSFALCIHMSQFKGQSSEYYNSTRIRYTKYVRNSVI